MSNFSKDYISDIIDEIALEGLDGITLEALWVRLSERPRFMFKPTDEHVKKFLWTIVSKLPNVEFFSLPVARQNLFTFNRLEHIDSNGNFYEPEDLPPCIYPHCPIEDNGIMGSCSTYKERENISQIVRKEPYEVVLRRGNQLVIVADQATRSKAICSMDFNPLTELGVIQYCILERIGRSRYQGEVTQGKRGLQVVTDDPKMLYYFKKLLVKNKLVMKQLFYMKVQKQTSTGSLIHLPRFYTEIKTRQDADAVKLASCLENAPNKCMPLKSVKTSLNMELKKLLMKYPNNFKTTVVPYRTINPSSKPSDWKMKSNGEERSVRVVMLTNSNLSKDDDEDEDDEEEIGLMDESQRRLDRCLIRQAYSLVEQAGPKGIKQSTLGNLLAVPSLQARSICKHLVKKKLVRTVLIDIGRQRISHFYCTKFDSSEYTLSKEVRDEKTKLLEAINVNTELCDENSPTDKNCSVTPSNQRTEVSEVLLVKEKKPDAIEDMKNTSLSENPPAKNSSAPPLNSEEIEAEIIIQSTADRPTSGLTEEIKYLDKGEPSNILTARMLKRASLIVQSINVLKVIQDYQKIQKIINEEEESEGLKQTVDRKTVQRLLEKLESDGLVRIIKVNLKGHGKEKNMVFICHPTVNENHSEIQSAIEQAKMKLPIVSAHHTKKSILKKSQDKRLKLPIYKHDIRAGRKYGFKPKFIRMRIFHMYMYYLIYGYDGSSNLDQSCKLDILKQLDLDESLLEEMSTVYRNEIDWKMFLPPLPTHAEYPEGWCLLSDVLLRLPLCLFVSIVNVSFDIPGLLEYIEHPLKRYFLVKHLPQEIIHHLTLMRKYIFVISEIVHRLANIGITQMGPQKLKEKDQVFIYLNRNAILYNTVPSDPGYNQISTNKTYEVISYHFNSLDDLETYWYDLWNFAMNTNLGIRNSMTGQSVVVESVNTKKELLATIQPKTVEEAKACDVGYLPGDHLGAAGLDSDMFVHLKRNWYWTGKGKSDDSIQRSIYPIAIKELYNKPLKKKKVQEVVPMASESSDPPVEKLKKAKNTAAHSQFKLASTARKSKAVSKKKTRIVKQRKSKYARKPYYDQIDKDALSRMVKLRVDWSPTEDNLLLICKVASLYLSPDKRRHVAKNFCAVREVLHSTYPLSRNKTSRACQRRMRYMMKNPSTAHSVYLCLEEVKQDPEINGKFFGAMEKLDALLRSQGEGPKGYQQEYDKIFVNLVHALMKKLKNINNCDNANIDVSVPQSLAEFHAKYQVVVPRALTLRYGSFQEVHKTMDILASVVNSVIHSSLCCTTDKTSYSQHLFYIYQQYPDRLLRSVMAKCRAMSVVSCRKRYKRWKTAGSDCLPLASSPYQLSITYVHILQSKYQYNIFSECYNGLKMMLSNDSAPMLKSDDLNSPESSDKLVLNIEVNSGGECANIVELFSAGLIEMQVEFPDQLIVLDPRLSETEESYKLIMKRFREMLSIIKDARQKEKKTLLSEEEFDEDEDEDKAVSPEEEMSEPYLEQFNLKNKVGVANTASRLALYLMRDEPLEQLDQSLQHAHDYFVLNPCKVTAQLDKAEVENTIFFRESKMKILSDIKRLYTFPGNEVENDHIINNLKTDYREELIASLLKYLENKGDLGATFKNIKVKFGESKEIKELLLRLVYEQYILKTGVVNVRYVHPKFVKPWLVKSFHLLRHNRENLESFNYNSTYAISFINSDKKKRKAKTETVVDTSQSNPSVSEEIQDEPLTKKIKPNEISSENMEIDSMNASSQKNELLNERCSQIQNVESKRKHEEYDSCSDGVLPNKIVKLSESFECVSTERIDEHFEDAKPTNSTDIDENVSSSNSDPSVTKKLPHLPDLPAKENETSSTSDPPISNNFTQSSELISNLEKEDVVSSSISDQNVSKTFSQSLDSEADFKQMVKESAETKEDIISSSTSWPPISKNCLQSSELVPISNLESSPCTVGTKENSICSSIADPFLSKDSSQSLEPVSDSKQIVRKSNPCTAENKEDKESSLTSEPPLSNNSSLDSDLGSKLHMGSNSCSVETMEGIESSTTSEPPVSKDFSQMPGTISESKQITNGTSPDSTETISDSKQEDKESSLTFEPPFSNNSLLKSDLGSNSCSVETMEGIESSTSSKPPVSNNTSQMPGTIPDSKQITNGTTPDSTETKTDSKQEDKESSLTFEPPVSNNSLHFPVRASDLEKLDVESNSCAVGALGDNVSPSTSQQPVSNNSSQLSEVISNSEKTEESVEENSRVIMKATRRKWVSMSNENFSQLTKFNASDVKNVNIVPRPWIKVDGNLNRRVLDRMLGSVLGHCLTCPGITVQKLQERFTPALQPVHTFELVEILQRIGCVKLFTMKRSWKCSLFSERARVSKEPSTGLESPADMLVNTDPLAISKLGYFIGDKNYTIDYLDALTDSKVRY